MKGKLSAKNLVVITLALMLLAALAYMRFSPDPAVAEAVGPEGVVFGPADASVTVVVFLSPVCSHCQAFEKTSAPTLYKAAEAGAIRYVVYPVKTGSATERNMASLICAAEQNAFPEFLGARFSDPRDALALAGLLRLDEATFTRCLTRPATTERTQHINAWAKQLQVHATPTFYINDAPDRQFRKVEGDKGLAFWEALNALAVSPTQRATF